MAEAMSRMVSAPTAANLRRSDVRLLKCMGTFVIPRLGSILSNEGVLCARSRRICRGGVELGVKKRRGDGEGYICRGMFLGS